MSNIFDVDRTAAARAESNIFNIVRASGDDKYDAGAAPWHGTERQLVAVVDR